MKKTDNTTLHILLVGLHALSTHHSHPICRHPQTAQCIKNNHRTVDTNNCTTSHAITTAHMITNHILMVVVSWINMVQKMLQCTINIMESPRILPAIMPARTTGLKNMLNHMALVPITQDLMANRITTSIIPLHALEHTQTPITQGPHVPVFLLNKKIVLRTRNAG